MSSGAAAAVPGGGSGPSHALRQVQESARVLLAAGKTEEAWELFLSALEAVLVKNRELELLVAKLRRERMNPASERMDAGQLSLLFGAMMDQPAGDEPVDPELEAKDDAALSAEIESVERAQGRKPSRSEKYATRGIEQHVHREQVAETERACQGCGKPMQRMGEDVTRRLEYLPARFVEHVHHLEKLACGSCKDGVTTAAAPEQVLERSTATASLLAHVVVSKYSDHVPLHRLHRIYARSGADIPVSTLCDWVAGVGELIEPLMDPLKARVLSADVVRTDATGLKVLDPTSPDNIERGTMWAYVGDDVDVLFEYTETGEGATGPWKLLAGRTGYVQADALNVHDRIFDGKVASAIEVGCWAHARRRFVDLKDSDCRAAYPLMLIARMYRIEHLADVRRLDVEGRTRLRKERTRPVLEKLHRWLAATHAAEPPSAGFAKAARYALNQWDALARFADDGRLDLDNNACEQQLRDVALGRKNFLFAGSHDAARRTAAIYSLMRTCAQHGVPPMKYFTDVLRTLSTGWPAARLAELLPGAWKAAHPIAPR